MQEVKHIQFLEVSFNKAIFALKLTVSSVSAEFLNAQAVEASKIVQYFSELQKEELTTFLSPTFQNIQPPRDNRYSQRIIYYNFVWQLKFVYSSK